MTNYRNRPPRGADVHNDVIEKEIVESPSTQPSLPARKEKHEDETLEFDKKGAAHFLGICIATFDRARTKKREGVPGYEFFPEDYRPSGNKRGRLRFKRSELVRWRDRDTSK